MNSNHSGSLEEQVGELRSRVRRLEEALTRQGILSQEFALQPPTKHASATQASAPPPPPPGIEQAAAPWTAALPIAAPSFGSYSMAAAEDERSLENRIGSQWFNRIGILAGLIAMAWFLKLAVDNHWIGRWIGPSGRVLIGLCAGAGFIAWSERFRMRGYVVFSYSLKAVGSGTLYLSLWAAFSLYHLIPPPVAFAAMVLVTGFIGLDRK